MGLTLLHYRNWIESELGIRSSVDHVEVLGQLMERYRQLDFAKSRDLPKVFPLLK